MPKHVIQSFNSLGLPGQDSKDPFCFTRRTFAKFAWSPNSRLCTNMDVTHDANGRRLSHFQYQFWWSHCLARCYCYLILLRHTLMPRQLPCLYLLRLADFCRILSFLYLGVFLLGLNCCFWHHPGYVPALP